LAEFFALNPQVFSAISAAFLRGLCG